MTTPEKLCMLKADTLEQDDGDDHPVVLNCSEALALIEVAHFAYLLLNVINNRQQYPKPGWHVVQELQRSLEKLAVDPG